MSEEGLPIKRRKQEDRSLGKKVKDHKDKLGYLMKNNIPPASVNAASNSFTINNHDQLNLIFSEARLWLAENNQAFDQISPNLSALKETPDVKKKGKYWSPLSHKKQHRINFERVCYLVNLMYVKLYLLTTYLVKLFWFHAYSMSNMPGTRAKCHLYLCS